MPIESCTGEPVRATSLGPAAVAPIWLRWAASTADGEGVAVLVEDSVPRSREWIAHAIIDGEEGTGLSELAKPSISILEE